MPGLAAAFPTGNTTLRDIDGLYYSLFLYDSLLCDVSDQIRHIGKTTSHRCLGIGCVTFTWLTLGFSESF